MIKAGAEFAFAMIPIEKIIVVEHQVRYPDRLNHYINLMSQTKTDYPGFILLKPRDDGYYEVEDGHHRFLSYVMTGRTEVLSIVIKE